ncbi:MAG: 5-formyltetrahydrofolate cyclo-ligase [Desulfuromonadales bacterium]|jgi:5-formyltetrahydrofolate cyclo-ligase|nr:5-formyltetrahydrofolate cyclo-ligase [Desulfuromonadales bacterium]
MPKKSLRGTMLARRKHMAAEICLSQSIRIQQRVMALPAFRQADVLALYSPILNEVFTEEIFQEALRLGKTIAYPRVRGESLDFVLVASPQELEPGAFGVLEPTGSRLVPSGALDLVLVPGVAFDLEGYRLGYGKGFYDRVLCGAGRPALSIGLCFELQVVDRLPVEDHDQCLDLVITEERDYPFTPSGRCMLEST